LKCSPEEHVDSGPTKKYDESLNRSMP